MVFYEKYLGGDVINSNDIRKDLGIYIKSLMQWKEHIV